MDAKTAIITGGSRGIGAAAALRLAQDGFHLLIGCKSGTDKALEVAARCEALGVKALVRAWDVSDPKQCEDAVQYAVEQFGRIDVLVNNAGMTKDGLLVRMGDDQFDEVIGANLKSTFSMMKACAKVMMKARRGTIINLSSVAGVYGNAGQANYSAAKAGIIGLTKAASKELGGRGITVNAVAPGFIDTDMTAALPDTVKEAAKERIALRRFGTVEDIAGIISFLASEGASYITGQTIVADGGLSL